MAPQKGYLIGAIVVTKVSKESSRLDENECMVFGIFPKRKLKVFSETIESFVVHPI